MGSFSLMWTGHVYGHLIHNKTKRVKNSAFYLTRLHDTGMYVIACDVGGKINKKVCRATYTHTPRLSVC
jgi:hypothetical protein